MDKDPQMRTSYRTPILLLAVSISCLVVAAWVLVKAIYYQEPIRFSGEKKSLPRPSESPEQQKLPTRISLATASSEVLESLPGIGVVTAEKIIQNRPYTRLEELVEKHILTPSVFEANKDKLSL